MAKNAQAFSGFYYAHAVPSTGAITGKSIGIVFYANRFFSDPFSPDDGNAIKRTGPEEVFFDNTTTLHDPQLGLMQSHIRYFRHETKDRDLITLNGMKKAYPGKEHIFSPSKFSVGSLPVLRRQLDCLEFTKSAQYYELWHSAASLTSSLVVLNIHLVPNGKFSVDPHFRSSAKHSITQISNSPTGSPSWIDRRIADVFDTELELANVHNWYVEKPDMFDALVSERNYDHIKAKDVSGSDIDMTPQGFEIRSFNRRPTRDELTGLGHVFLSEANLPAPTRN